MGRVFPEDHGRLLAQPGGVRDDVDPSTVRPSPRYRNNPWRSAIINLRLESDTRPKVRPKQDTTES